MIYCAELSLTDDGLQWLPMHCSILIMQCTELIVTQMGLKFYKNDVKVILCIALSPLFLNGCKNFVAVLQWIQRMNFDTYKSSVLGLLCIAFSSFYFKFS